VRAGGNGVPRLAMTLARPCKKPCCRCLREVEGCCRLRIAALGCDIDGSRKEAEFGVGGKPWLFGVWNVVCEAGELGKRS
jgi:hypothetical protein